MARLVVGALMMALVAFGADVVVYGGSAAGVTAAIAARQSGREVVLVAPERHVGGFAVEGLGSSDINNHWFRNDEAVGGLAREF
ncbi:MAG: FAD-dependent oxidoreductase, partial [Bryobacteraceae bacterium]|nr:FAD-dependent oxidoreductase [Bryobacteraceae bacterium]